MSYESELKIEYTFEKASERLDAFSEGLDKFAQTDDWFWDTLLDLHRQGPRIL